MANRVIDKKQALLARKETLLKELQYYERRIEEERKTKSNSSFYGDDSSDSEQECIIDIGPSITELKLHQSMLKTCLHATQELTSVQVLQSEVNVLIEDPVFEGEPPVTEQGVWRDVIVECRVDLVPFSMNFYAHKPDRLFAPISYRNLQVTAVKAAHEKELSKSVLSTVTTPSDAIEVFRSYAAAHRSRRGTLARLAEAYADSLHMEPLSEGGYMLKCANLLEVSWTLQNKWSPIAPFHHKMRFDVEYMDESYIKIITQAHKQLSDPTIETDERTLLLSKIIKTCLEAQKPTQELHESFDSDSLKEKRQTLEEPEVPIKDKDSEIMAPPKYPPKKVKAKGKENVNKDKKRPSNTENEENVKRAKLDSNKDDKIANTKNKVSSKVVKEDAKAKKSNLQVDKVDKNDNTSKSSTSNKVASDDNAKAKKSNSQVDKVDKNDNSSKNSKATKELNDDNAKTKKVNSPVDKVDQNNDKSKPTNNKLSKGVTDNNAKAKRHTVNDKINKNDNTSKPVNKINDATSVNNLKNDMKSFSTTKKDGKALPDPKKSNNVASSKNDGKKQLDSNTNKVKKAATVKNTEVRRTDTENVEKNPKSTDKTKPKATDDVTKQPKPINKEIENTDKHSKNAKNNTESTKNIPNTNKNNEKNDIKKSDKPKQINLAERFNKNKVTAIKNTERQNVKLFKSDVKNKMNIINEQRKSKSLNKISKNIVTSKIPQKRLSSENFKKNPLRISPKRPQSNSNSVNDSSKTSIRSIQKVVTNIPRLLKKPITKPKTMV